MKINILKMFICGSSSVCGHYTINNQKRKHKFNFRINIPEFYDNDYLNILRNRIEQLIKEEIGE